MDINHKEHRKIDILNRNRKTNTSTNANLDSNKNITNHAGEIEKFHGSQGHGFAAERANDMIDRFHGKEATILGDDNAKNGADRMVDGKLIQTKYCQTAAASVDAAFENGQYRYIDAKGKVMQLEVPSDQYEQAIAEMRKRIAKGQVPGHRNPKDAEKIVRKGNVTYAQAKNIAKAGNIESITFDAMNSAVIAASALGITAAITFAKSIWDGKDYDVAIEKSLCSGLQVGGVAFVSSLFTSQLVKAGADAALKGSSEVVVKSVLNKSGKEMMVNYFEQGHKMFMQTGTKQMTATQATNKSAKLLRNNVVAMAVMIVALSSGDICNAFRGRISGAQLFKNVMSLAVGMGGGIAGSMAGAKLGTEIGAIIPIPGTAAVGFFLGGLVGGTLASSGTNAVLSEFIEDDAKEMVRILEKRFVVQAENYMLSQEEVDIAVDDLQKVLSTGTKLLEMFASKDRDAFADELISGVIDKLVCFRSKIFLPSSISYMSALDRMEDRMMKGIAVINDAEVDAVEIGKNLLGKELDKNVAKKSWYMTKQMNSINMQAEVLLERARDNEQNKSFRLSELEKEKQELQKYLNEYIGEC